MSDSDVDLAELSEKAELLADATGRDKADVMADLLDDGILNESNKETKGILDKANEQAEKAKALLMTVLPVVAILLGGGGAEMLGITDFTGLGDDDEPDDDYYYDPTWDIIYGCTDYNAQNYEPYATDDDGSCYYPVYGCTNDAAPNYNPEATEDDGSCEPLVEGCTDPEAENYDDEANEDDGSCEYYEEPDPADCLVAIENHYRGHIAEDSEQDAVLIAFKVAPDGCEGFELDIGIELYQNGYAANYTHWQVVSGDSDHDISHAFDGLTSGTWIPKIIAGLDGVQKENVNFWAIDIEEPECEGTASFYQTQTKWLIESNNNTTSASAEIKWDADWSCDEEQYMEVDIYIVDENGTVAWSKVAAFNTTGNSLDWKTVVWDENVSMTMNYTLTLSIWTQNDSGGWDNPEVKVINLGIPEESI